MNKERSYLLLAGGLLLSNVLLVGFMFLRPGPRGPHHDAGPRDRIIEMLKMDEAQVRSYDALIERHKKEVGRISKETAMLKDQLYATLGDSATNLRDSLFLKLNNLNAEAERLHYDHFSEMRILCRPDQLPAFEELKGELGELFARRGHPPHGGPNR